ncbi:hypothetical protein [Streptomyces sp. NPDC058157]|uniref:hypothetical protein n=1 Tax=Streptomyces sp. NPDC058157 TaxID=3346360 RepID=UPI0036F0B597
MLKITVSRTLFAAALLGLCLTTTAATSATARTTAAAAGPTVPAVPAGFSLEGVWKEPIARDRPGITHYTQALTFHETTFEQVPGFQCNQSVCPAVKLGVNQGTYTLDRRQNTINLHGNLSNLTGNVKNTDTIEIDGHTLHRAEL